MTLSGFSKLKEESKSGLSLRRAQLGILGYFDTGAIEKLYEAVNAYVAEPAQERIKHLISEEYDEETLQAIHEEEDYYGAQIKDLAIELAVIALYKMIEINSVRAIKIALPEGSTKRVYKYDVLKKILTKEGIDVEKLPGYNEVDEIRRINNCIKHSDSVVNDALAQISGWEKGKSLGDLSRHFHRLAEAAKIYMDGFVKELIKKLS